jgi:hypothetical protein
MSIETEKKRLTGALNCKDELAVFVRTSARLTKPRLLA